MGTVVEAEISSVEGIAERGIKVVTNKQNDMEWKGNEYKLNGQRMADRKYD